MATKHKKKHYKHVGHGQWYFDITCRTRKPDELLATNLRSRFGSNLGILFPSKFKLEVTLADGGIDNPLGGSPTWTDCDAATSTPSIVIFSWYHPVDPGVQLA